MSGERKGVGFERREQQRAPELALFFVCGGSFWCLVFIHLKNLGDAGDYTRVGVFKVAARQIAPLHVRRVPAL